MSAGKSPNAAPICAVVVISIAVVGYFTGLQLPMQAPHESLRLRVDDAQLPHNESRDDSVIPATRYADMAAVTRRHRRPTQLASLKSTTNPLGEIRIGPEDKRAALRRREQNRAFNGAPPTIPHPTDQHSDASCVACHGDGILTKTLRIPRMSHDLLANCTQCHVESNPEHMTAMLFRENEFVGLAAPTSGPRAFQHAPPQIPHSTWMRSECLSCHGDAGLHGMRTTHPWRSNCQQCHAPSAAMDQTLLAQDPHFLPSPKIKD